MQTRYPHTNHHWISPIFCWEDCTVQRHGQSTTTKKTPGNWGNAFLGGLAHVLCLAQKRLQQSVQGTWSAHVCVSCTDFAWGAPAAHQDSAGPSCSIYQWWFLITHISLSHRSARWSFCRLILATTALHSGSITSLLLPIFFILLPSLGLSLRTKDHHQPFFSTPIHPFNKT